MWIKPIRKHLLRHAFPLTLFQKIIVLVYSMSNIPNQERGTPVLSKRDWFVKAIGHISTAEHFLAHLGRSSRRMCVDGRHDLHDCKERQLREFIEGQPDSGLEFKIFLRENQAGKRGQIRQVETHLVIEMLE